jgi:hypothetical protein
MKDHHNQSDQSDYLFRYRRVYLCAGVGVRLSEQRTEFRLPPTTVDDYLHSIVEKSKHRIATSDRMTPAALMLTAATVCTRNVRIDIRGPLGPYL